MEFSTLGQLFEISVELTKKAAKRVTMNPNVLIPICQHNIYKLAPYHIHPVQEISNRFEIWLTKDRAKLLDDMDCPPGSFDQFEDGSGIKYVPISAEQRASCAWKTPEDRDANVLLSCAFNSTKEFSLDDLGIQFYLSYANSFNYETWYNVVKDFVFKNPLTGQESQLVSSSYLIDLSEQEVQRIYDMHLKSDRGKYLGQAYSDLLEMKRDIQTRLDPFVNLVSSTKIVESEDKDEPPITVIEPFYFKLNTRSAKDSTYYKESGVLAAIKKDSSSLKKCQARNAFDMLSAMVASQRASEDCRSYIAWKIKSGRKPSLKLVIQKYIEFPARFEIRLWVYNGKVTGINPLMFPNYMNNYEDVTVREDIRKISVSVVTQTHHLVPWNNYILDIIYNPEKKTVQICEYNPWGPYSSTGSQLYSWELDMDILFGENKSDVPDFRYLHRGMEVRDMFWLMFSKDLFVPTETFMKSLSMATQRCPCCPRSDGVPPPQTKVMHLCSDSNESDVHQEVQDVISMAILVRNDLKMTSGKMAVQFAHAAVNAYIKMNSKQTEFESGLLKKWLEFGQPKIALQISSLQELNDIRISAEQNGIHTYIVQDAGKTQIRSGEKTCVALGPAPSSKIKLLTKDLALL